VSPRLLILDDDDAILSLLQRYFDGLGWRVQGCTEVLDGLRLVESNPFDAVICDLHLGPGQDGDGLSIITRVRERRPEAAVVLFTAAAGDGVRAAALKAGADRVIAKPAPLAHLRDATVRAMKSR
jgi:two-component system response regulator RegA